MIKNLKFKIQLSKNIRKSIKLSKLDELHTKKKLCYFRGLKEIKLLDYE